MVLSYVGLTPGRDRKRLKNLGMVLGDIYCEIVLVPLAKDRPVGKASLPEDSRACLYLRIFLFS